MNRTVLVLVALLVMAGLVGGYSARGRFLLTAPGIKGSLAPATVESSVVQPLSYDNIFSEGIVEAVVLRAGTSAPVVRRQRQKSHPVEVLAQSAKIGAAIILGNLLRISNVSVTGNYYVADEEVARVAGVSGSPWIWDSPFSLVQSRLERYSWIAEPRLSWRLFPLSLTIEIAEAKPWIVAELGKESWLISKNGALLQPLRTIKDTQLILDTVGLPRLDGLLRKGESPDSVTTMSSRLAKSVSILAFYQIVEEFPFPVDRFTYLDDSAILITPVQRKRFPAVVVDGESFSDAKTSLANLKTVLKDIEQRQEKATRIDLRFKGQAVVRLAEEAPRDPRAINNSPPQTTAGASTRKKS